MNALEQVWKDIPAPRRPLVLGVGALVIAATVGVGWWALAPDYRPLFVDLAERDAAEVIAALDGLKVPHKLGADGHSVLVPADKLDDARMRLVADGVPAHGSVGFELFNEADYGMTEFAQKVNFQRALQGELERTISALAEVQQARVHLTLRRQGLFLRDQDPPKASVTITARDGLALDARQIAGIQSLVAAAVEGLTPDAVVVLDDRGNPLAGGEAGGVGADVGARRAEQREIEVALRAKLDELLGGVFGLRDYTVSVDVALNFDRVKQVREELLAQGADGNGLLVRRNQSHTPARGRAGDAESHDAGTTEVEYAHGRSTQETVYAPGRIERLSIGIVVPASFGSDELARLERLVGAAVGLDARRGDRLEVAALGASTAAMSRHATGTAAGGTHARAAAEAAAPERPALSWLLLVALLGAVLGAIVVAFATPRGPRRLNTAERDQALRQVQRWVAGESTRDAA